MAPIWTSQRRHELVQLSPSLTMPSGRDKHPDNTSSGLGYCFSKWGLSITWKTLAAFADKASRLMRKSTDGLIQDNELDLHPAEAPDRNKGQFVFFCLG